MDPFADRYRESAFAVEWSCRREHSLQPLAQEPFTGALSNFQVVRQPECQDPQLRDPKRVSDLRGYVTSDIDPVSSADRSVANQRSLPLVRSAARSASGEWRLLAPLRTPSRHAIRFFAKYVQAVEDSACSRFTSARATKDATGCGSGHNRRRVRLRLRHLRQLSIREQPRGLVSMSAELRSRPPGRRR